MNAKTALALVISGLVFLPGAGCDPRYIGGKEERDAGKLRPECHPPTTECYRGCFKRNEGEDCGTCCYTQMIHCDDQKKYSFESCAGKDPDTRTH